MIALVLAVVLWFSSRNKKVSKRVALTILFPYLFLVIVSTIITRRVSDNRHLILRPFWTIQTILAGGRKKAWLVKEVILNILMLVPVGLLTPVLLENKKLARTLLTGLGLSVTIELLQLVTYRGFAEIDDIIFNMLGVFIGYGIYRVAKRIMDTAR